jgi:hypothetical protein
MPKLPDIQENMIQAIQRKNEKEEDCVIWQKGAPRFEYWAKRGAPIRILGKKGRPDSNVGQKGAPRFECWAKRGAPNRILVKKGRPKFFGTNVQQRILKIGVNRDIILSKKILSPYICKKWRY